MNFGYFGVFWRIFFGYTGIPLPLMADPGLFKGETPAAVKVLFIDTHCFATYFTKWNLSF